MHIPLYEFFSISFDVIADKTAEHVIILYPFMNPYHFLRFNGKIIIVHLL